MMMIKKLDKTVSSNSVNIINNLNTFLYLFYCVLFYLLHISLSHRQSEIAASIYIARLALSTYISINFTCANDNVSV